MRPNPEEYERFCSRLSRVAGLELQPSHGAWVLIKHQDPESFARRLEALTYPGAVSVPQHLANTVRIPVREPKQNEAVLAGIVALMGELEQDPESLQNGPAEEVE
jgi:histidinol-phosphate/aromatic aminotransferase/cobyric acid decarboxylase-like protein